MLGLGFGLGFLYGWWLGLVARAGGSGWCLPLLGWAVVDAVRGMREQPPAEDPPAACQPVDGSPGVLLRLVQASASTPRMFRPARRSS